MRKADRGFSIPDRMRSLGYAAKGLAFMLRTQHNARLHLAATATVLAVGLGLHVSPGDWKWLTVAIALVWVAEAFNTAFEHLCDVVSPQFHPAVEKAKDVGAAAVLICAAAATALGALTLWPYLWK